jgi:nicotinic acid phosphoribosyltransferase
LLFVAIATRYPAGAIHLDSGDLAYLSKEVRKLFKSMAEKTGVKGLEKAVIMASNDVDEEVLYNLSLESHKIDSFGIGTNLVCSSFFLFFLFCSFFSSFFFTLSFAVICYYL